MKGYVFGLATHALNLLRFVSCDQQSGGFLDPLLALAFFMCKIAYFEEQIDVMENENVDYLLFSKLTLLYLDLLFVQS